MIYGREHACDHLESLLSAVRLQGRGGSLVLSGPPGIGKTTLLNFAEEKAEGFQVLRAKGSPAEVGMPYSGLMPVLTPLLELLPSLPPFQVAAIEAALAIGPAAGTDAFPVLAGTLSLLAAAAVATPLAVLIDDCQWLDNDSMNALLFAHRRLTHDRVLFVFTARTGVAAAGLWSDLPSIELSGLDLESARSLLRNRGVLVSDDVLHWLVRATGGNPLALLDLPTYVSAAELAVMALRSEPAPATPALTVAYQHSLSVMPADARQALLIAAMLDDMAIEVAERALDFAGLAITALAPAEDAGLVRLANGVVSMRHPLARSAVIDCSAPSARRAAHLASADGLLASARHADAQARIWHLADAAVGVNEPLAQLLEEQARSATARAGYAAACLIHRRAADLSAVGEDRTQRLLAAAESALTAGMNSEGTRLIHLLESEHTGSADQVARAAHLKGRLRSIEGDPPGAARELQSQAEKLRRINPALAIQVSVDAGFAAVLAGQMGRAAEAAQLTACIGPELGPNAIALGDLMVGTVQAMSGAGDNARVLLDSCRQVIDVADPPVDVLQQIVYLATAYLMINALQDAAALLERGIAIARRRGAIGILPFALAISARTSYQLGDWEIGYACATEALTLAGDSGQTAIRPNALAVLALIDAARGVEQARGEALSTIDEASAVGATFLEAQGLSVLGLYELGIGNPAAAITPLERCGQLSHQFGFVELGHLQWAAELIEAKLRCGDGAAAGPTLRTMRDATHSGSTALAQALTARCEGMLATDSTWEDQFHTALELHSGANARPFELARTELCFGERLRRNRRRKEARAHLSRAWETFASLGAHTWALRASQEIVSTGGTSPGPISHVFHLLTPQELQVATIVAAGATNREAATALFLSQKTIEFHLSAIYRRLELRNRADLAKALDGLIAFPTPARS
jgi:DNA-binding CsgD family transcriptional regulator